MSPTVKKSPRRLFFVFSSSLKNSKRGPKNFIQTVPGVPVRNRLPPPSRICLSAPSGRPRRPGPAAPPGGGRGEPVLRPDQGAAPRRGGVVLVDRRPPPIEH